MFLTVMDFRMPNRRRQMYIHYKGEAGQNAKKPRSDAERRPWDEMRVNGWGWEKNVRADLFQFSRHPVDPFFSVFDTFSLAAFPTFQHGVHDHT